jgi:tellurium resistance protein TerD
VKVKLASLAPEVDKTVLPVSVYDAETRQQSLGRVRNAFIRIANDQVGAEIARYDRSEDASAETVMIFGEVYWHGAEWMFRTVS